MGFGLISDVNYGQLGLRLARLATPPGLPADLALVQLQAQIPQTVVLNSLYRPAREEAAGNLPNLRLIGWSESAERCGRGLRIGMIDTKVAGGFNRTRLVTRAFGPAKSESAPRAHGTAVASLLIGSRASGLGGLVPAAQLYAAGVFYRDRDGGDAANVNDIVAAMDWLLQQRVTVVNMSFAGAANEVLREALRRAQSRGLLAVAAAGNGGPAAAPAYPAAYPQAIAVTAVDRFRRPYRAANQGNYVSLAAPGVNLWTAHPEKAGLFGDGTSLAASFVTAAAAEWRHRHKSATPSQTAAALEQAAQDLGPPGRDRIFGWGLLRSEPRC
ncbi:MAG: hypothetical protein Kilf2KO_26970 [Rhodospirillales bacterium]